MSPEPAFAPAPRARSQLRDEASSYIRSLIVSGQLLPNSYVRLAPLAEALGMSVTPIREAMMSLREQGFVELVPNHGFRVLQIAPGDVADLFLVQSFAAGELAARTASLATNDLVRELEDLHLELLAAAKRKDGRACELVNDRFHELINRSAESPRLAWFYESAIPIIPRRFLALVPGWIDASVLEHQHVLEGIRGRSPDEARLAMGAHIKHVGLLVADHLKDGGPWPGEG